LSPLLFRSSSAGLIIKIEGVHAVIKSAVIDEDDSSLKTVEENDVIKKRNQLNIAEQQFVIFYSDVLPIWILAVANGLQ